MSTRAAGLSHPWGATSCTRKAAPLTNYWLRCGAWARTCAQEDGCAVNAGVYMLDVREYAAHKIQFHIAELISIHEKRLQNNMKGIWKRGVHQPSFVLALYNYTQRMDQVNWACGGRQA